MSCGGKFYSFSHIGQRDMSVKPSSEEMSLKRRRQSDCLLNNCLPWPKDIETSRMQIYLSSSKRQSQCHQHSAVLQSVLCSFPKFLFTSYDTSSLFFASWGKSCDILLYYTISDTMLYHSS